jgi:2-polyprenyl-6-methoxyphenol hydroxylase-like FAD-dependent oxidoreductase
MTDGGLDADVAIVGYGPVGATLAILLARQGRSVVVLERQPHPYPLPRAVHMDHEVARIIQSCGLGEDLARISEPADLYEWRNGDGLTLLRLGRTGVGLSGWPQSLMFNQPTLEVLVDRQARAVGVHVRRGVEVTGLTQDESGVTIETATGQNLRASYAVGCDGANSGVRQQCQVSMQDLGFFYDWLIVDVILRERRVFDPPNLQVCDPRRPTTVVSGGPGRRRWEFMRLPHETRAELNSAARAWELLEPWDVHPDNADLERHAVYTFNARYAQRWRSGRVFLAGDAAHQTPPFAGQGMCAGIRDAANLAWKLDLVLTGRAADELLDTYEPERRPEVCASIEFAMELGKIICVPDQVEAAARDQAMAASVGPDPAEVPPLLPIQAGIIDPRSPHAGRLFPQGRVDGKRFDDVYGTGWRLIALGDTPQVDDEAARWFDTIGGQVVTVPADDPVYGTWFAAHSCTAALQRPDFHLYGTAADPQQTGALLSGLRARISPTHQLQGVVL